MKSLLTLLTVVLVIAMISVIIYGGYYSIEYLWNLYAQLEFTTRTVLLSIMSILLIGVFVIARAIRSATSANEINSLFEARVTLYKKLVSLYRDYLDSSSMPTSQKKADLKNEFREIEADLSLLPGASTINLLEKLQASIETEQNYDQLVDLYQKMIKAMRRDLGQGTGYDESKLKFLLSVRNKENNNPDTSVSL